MEMYVTYASRLETFSKSNTSDEIGKRWADTGFIYVKDDDTLSYAGGPIIWSIPDDEEDETTLMNEDTPAPCFKCVCFYCGVETHTGLELDPFMAHLLLKPMCLYSKCKISNLKDITDSLVEHMDSVVCNGKELLYLCARHESQECLECVEVFDKGCIVDLYLVGENCTDYRDVLDLICQETYPDLRTEFLNAFYTVVPSAPQCAAMASSTPATNEDDTCCVCLLNESNVQIYKCGHSLCLDCLM